MKILLTFLISTFVSALELAEVSYLNGRALLQQGLRQTPVTVGQSLAPGDRIIVELGSELTLDLKDKGSIRFFGPATAEIPVNHSGSRLNFLSLAAGKVWCSIKTLLQGDSFEVKTPTATAGVRGTDFQVAFDQIANLTQTIVAKGVVDVTNLNGEMQKLTEGMVANINTMTTSLVNDQLRAVEQFLSAMKIPLNNSAEALKASEEMVKNLQGQIDAMQKQLEQQMNQFQENLQNNLDQMQNQIDQNMQQFNQNLQNQLQNQLQGLPGMGSNQQSPASDDDEDSTNWDMQWDED